LRKERKRGLTRGTGGGEEGKKEGKEPGRHTIRSTKNEKNKEGRRTWSKKDKMHKKVGIKKRIGEPWESKRNLKRWES